MAYPNVAGVPSYSGTFIPEVWSSKLIEKYYVLFLKHVKHMTTLRISNE